MTIHDILTWLIVSLVVLYVLIGLLGGWLYVVSQMGRKPKTKAPNRMTLKEFQDEYDNIKQTYVIKAPVNEFTADENWWR